MSTRQHPCLSTYVRSAAHNVCNGCLTISILLRPCSGISSEAIEPRVPAHNTYAARRVCCVMCV
eukprot:3130376-Rhodomonas_salina.1